MEEYGSIDDMAYGAIGHAVRRAMPHTEADPVGVLASLLALWSAAVQGHISQPRSGRPAVVWAVLVGRSGTGAKGVTADAAWRLMGPSLTRFLSTRVRDSFKSGAAIVQSLAELEEDTERSEQGADGRALLFEEELSHTLKAVNKDTDFGSTLIKAWERKRISNTVKTSKGNVETVVPAPLLGLYAHIQPATFRLVAKPQSAASGLFNRMLFIRVQSSQEIPIPLEERAPLEDVKPATALRDAYRWATSEPRTMHWSAKAVARLNALRPVLRAELEATPEEVSVFYERAFEQTLRVATILSAANMKEEISGKAVDAAAAFVGYANRSIKGVLEEAPKPGRVPRPLADLMADALDRHGGEMTATEMLRAVGSRFGAQQIRDEADRDPRVTWERVSTGNPGTKPIIFRLLSQSAPGRPSLRVVPAASLAPPARPPRPPKKGGKGPSRDPYRIELGHLV
ncbi:hypothetical protein C9F11_10235 [Streptomyces sp. YIM 121038]|uniref:DUF3987 domain-containing protein n=1 Tax=Streptomyces sp. YIM 121038 TaxID=2136401 RepID=UPI0011106F3C|nr:DUF3987 domain-containing protein [Streptomyces sp. YIM 121038]QCX75727.1 hypothetical protein C9F11_10235 [Streptomyces sp. YIM 121038]